MMAADPPSEKRRLRQAQRSLLRQVAPEAARAAGVRIAEHLAPSEAWRSAFRVVLFSSLSDEVDTSPIRYRASLDDKRVLLPRATEGGGLEFAVAGSPDRLRTGRFGVAEPPLDAEVETLTGGDLVLVPGLAFDLEGGRLGRGGGYYDRALAGVRSGTSRPILIGVGFSFQVIDHVPMTALDVCMDAVVSELGLSFAGRNLKGSIR